jgi:hypothetical protein
VADDEVDALYRVPLGEFTSARNALAKARGAAGGEIRALEKPTLSAWAVNQLYWRDRTVYDALVKAAVAMRQAHVQVISGHSADVGAAETTHAAARRDATQAARRLIEESGEKASPATIDAIAETLQALPAEDPQPGRLTKGLKPLGFSALMALGIPVVQGPRPTPRPASAPSPAADPGIYKQAEKRLRAAEAREAEAEAALAAAREAASQAERELERIRDQVQFLVKQRDDAEQVVRKRERALQDAANTRIQAAQDLLAQ